MPFCSAVDFLWGEGEFLAHARREGGCYLRPLSYDYNLLLLKLTLGNNFFSGPTIPSLQGEASLPSYLQRLHPEVLSQGEL